MRPFVALVAAVTLLGCEGVDRGTGFPPPQSREELPAWFGLLDAPSRAIRGRLLDGDRPLVGTVYLRIDVPDPTVWTGLERDTDADGHFDFGALRPGRYRVLAIAPGRVSRVVEVDTRGDAAEDLSIYAHACTPTRGRIADAGGVPVGGARVEIAGVVVAITDAVGAYSLCAGEEPVGAVVRAAGYGVGHVWAFERRLTQGPPLMPELALRGVVKREDGSPAAGVAVQPVYVEQVYVTHIELYGPVPLQAVTDAQGRFALRGVAPIDHASAGVADREPLPARYTFQVLDGDTVVQIGEPVADREKPEVVLELGRGEPRPAAPAAPQAPSATTISGRVLHDGEPLADARVTAVRAYSSNSTRTRADGGFELEAQEKGRVVVAVDHGSGLATERIVEIGPGARTSGIVIEVGDSGRITGTVVDADGRPLEDATLHLASRGTAVRRFGATGPDGAFALSAEVGQTYDLEVSNGDTGADTTIEIVLDADHPDVTGLRVIVGAAPAIVVDVTDEAGRPVVGATVLATQSTFEDLPGGFSRSRPSWRPRGVGDTDTSRILGSSLHVQSFSTDAKGRFTWAPVLDGPHAVMVIDDRGRVGAADDLVGGGPPVSIRVTRPGAVRVTCDGFEPMGGVSLARGQRQFHVGCGETVEQVPPGRYIVAAKAGMHRFARVEVDVRATGTVTAALAVAASGRIHGTVVDAADGAPLPGISCDAGISEGDGLARGDPGATSSADGVFELTISRGSVVVICEDDDGRYRRGRVDVELGEEATVTVRLERAAPTATGR